MTTLYLTAVLLAVVLLGTSTLRRDTRLERERVELERITAPLPVALRDLAGDWPGRQSPTDLAELYDDYVGRHRIGVAVGSCAQVHRWNAGTDAFTAIVDLSFDTAEQLALAAEWRCPSCAIGRDGERKHQSCAGCPCVCAQPVDEEEVLHVAA